jgi:hypothetical protein
VPNENIPTVLAGALHAWQPTAWADGRAGNRAREIARKAANLCMARGVLPELIGAEYITEVVIPPRLRPLGIVPEFATYSHGPVVVHCEYGCGLRADRVGLSADVCALVEAAVEASVFARGWAPIYVRLWQEVLRG